MIETVICEAGFTILNCLSLRSKSFWDPRRLMRTIDDTARDGLVGRGMSNRSSKGPSKLVWVNCRPRKKHDTDWVSGMLERIPDLIGKLSRGV